MIQICLWVMFFAGLIFTALTRVSPIGVIVTIGMLLLAIDYPNQKE